MIRCFSVQRRKYQVVYYGLFSSPTTARYAFGPLVLPSLDDDGFEISDLRPSVRPTRLAVRGSVGDAWPFGEKQRSCRSEGTIVRFDHVSRHRRSLRLPIRSINKGYSLTYARLIVPAACLVVAFPSEYPSRTRLRTVESIRIIGYLPPSPPATHRYLVRFAFDSIRGRRFG